MHEGDYCTLDKIKIVTHESSAKTAECIDCKSFGLH
ncbi:DUF1540 domain-containing protein [Clostridium beijerinckii]|nr:DUF1540 domain-containing protein [Clostridium beijerinckii]